MLFLVKEYLSSLKICLEILQSKYGNTQSFFLELLKLFPYFIFKAYPLLCHWRNPLHSPYRLFIPKP